MPDDDLDLLIDAALATYADPGSDSGLACRVLDRMAAEPTPRRRWLALGRPALLVPFALAALACLLLLIFVHIRPEIANPRSGQTNQAALLQKPGASIAGTRPRGEARRGGAAHAKTAAPRPQPVTLAANPEPPPKLDVFPTPQPPSPQERALAIFVVRTPPQPALLALAKSQRQETPLIVASLHVMPLEPPEPGTN